MLIISQRQLDLIADVRLRELHALLLERARRLFSVDVALMGDVALEEMVDYALRRARKHGIDATFDVFAYFDLMFALGSYFDVDPFLPWASATLTLPADASERMVLLREDAFAWIEGVTGEDGRPAIKAMLRAQSLTVQDVTGLRISGAPSFNAPIPDPANREPTNDMSAPDPDSNDPRERFRAFLADLHPEKFRTMGVDAVDRGVSDALRRADAADLLSPLGRHVYVILAFMLGSGFARDPLFPWVARALGDTRGMDHATLLFDAAKDAVTAAFAQMHSATSA